MQIYKNLPKTNCKDCGLPTCMAFAMQVAAKQRALTDCPHVSESGKNALAEASAPPMRLITVGAAEKQYSFGQETVMFRHEEKFHRRPGIAIRIPASLDNGQAAALAADVSKIRFFRVGENLGPAFCLVELDGVEDPAARAVQVSGNGCLPAVLWARDPASLAKAAQAISAERPLLGRAGKDTVAEMAKTAVAHKLPLAVWGETLAELADAVDTARKAGVEDIVLAFTGKDVAQTVRDLTIARRAALKRGFRIFGYPTLVEVVAATPESESMMASVFAAKYAGIVVISGKEAWELLPPLVTIQDIYTDPQVPNTVEAKLYAVGNPGDNSPVLFTTNFSLSYFSVVSEVERSKVPCWISVVETEGLGVLNAYAGDKISAEKVIKTLEEQKVAEAVKHRRLIIPGLLPMFRAEIEDGSVWKEVIIGPETAREIPGFLAKMQRG
jgi:acetyl-CoA decarbonylase/synthase complex subunit gamma